MEHAVTLPYWQFVLLLLLAAYAVLRIFVLPLVQKFIYRRFQATERILDEELEFGLPSFALAKRRLWVDRLMNDPEVRKTVTAVVKESGEPAHAIEQKARDYADEIVPSFNAFFYFRLGHWLAKTFLRMLFWVKVGFRRDGAYDRITKDKCVVVVSNHRSNFDPLMVIYMTTKRAPVSYSAGEWASVFPIRQVLHAIGAYIVRRDRKGDALYHCLLKRYVFLATSQCVPQGVFIEGGLTRDGNMLPLKLGLLNYLVSAYQQGNCKDIVFVPTGLNYDKIPEARTLIAHQEEGFKGKSGAYSILSGLRFIAAVTAYMMPRRHKPFGYACVNFGAPVSLSEWQQAHQLNLNTLEGSDRREAIDALGKSLESDIRDLIPILPTHILCKVLKESADTPLSEIELKVRAAEIAIDLAEDGAPVFIPKNDEDYAFSQGIYVLLREKIIQPTGDGRYVLLDESKKLFEYYCSTLRAD